MIELELVEDRQPPKGQLLKWIGNKHRSAAQIARFLPTELRRYIEPFVGGGAVLATMRPADGLAGDLLAPLVEIWKTLNTDPELLVKEYQVRWDRYTEAPDDTYSTLLASYNREPNPFDLLFLCRSCYGGVVRFTKQGTMSTPRGPHNPISPKAFALRVADWRPRIRHTEFVNESFEETMASAKRGDIIYCDPPYTYSQAILYGAQSFALKHLWNAIDGAASRGAKVALSIDGHKRSGNMPLHLGIPDGLFLREVVLDKGGSMLKRFQRRGADVSDERVADRLLFTW